MKLSNYDNWKLQGPDEPCPRSQYAQAMLESLTYRDYVRLIQELNLLERDDVKELIDAAIYEHFFFTFGLEE
jgi:hypothetical protein